MADVFYVSMLGDNGAEAFLNLPAAPWELLDAEDKLRLGEGEVPHATVEEFYRFDSLAPFLESGWDLYSLNALARKLAELDEEQGIAFEGLLQMEGSPISPPRLVDLAYSTDCCHVVDEALNDAQLGRFCAENGFVPGVDCVPDELFDLLDFERIGLEHRQREGGVLVERSADHPGGYVERHSEPAQVYKTLDLTLKTPDYTILLQVSKGFFRDSDYDSDRTVWLKLPAVPEDLDAALDKLGVWDWQEVEWSCLDCKVPSLTDLITGGEKDIASLNRFAQTLEEMEPEQLTAYKALLETLDCKDLGQAAQLAVRLDHYIFTPQFRSPVDVAIGELSVILAQRDTARIVQHLNVYQYGQSLIQQYGGVLTSYGLIEHKDGQNMQTIKHAPQRGGMEMG